METLEMLATRENLDQMIDFVVAKLQELELDNDQLLLKLRLACEEALMNVINHAYPEKTGKIKIVYQQQADKLILKIIDHGMFFNPLEYQTPDLTLSLEERSVGGLGIYIINRIMDQVEYQRKQQKNILTLIKLLP